MSSTGMSYEPRLVYDHVYDWDPTEFSNTSTCTSSSCPTLALGAGVCRVGGAQGDSAQNTLPSRLLEELLA